MSDRSGIRMRRKRKSRLIPRGVDLARFGHNCWEMYEGGRTWLSEQSSRLIADQRSVRPQTLADFTGQADVHATLAVFIKAARIRREALDHVLLVGPAGLGKTTLAYIAARELGVNIHLTSGPILSRPSELMGLLLSLKHRDILFIDEIHRLNAVVEELLYSALEDFRIDVIEANGRSARSVERHIPRFTLIGATTQAGLLTRPLRERFGISICLNFYSEEDLETIVSRGAQKIGVPITQDGASIIARSARGTPRIACQLLRRVADFAFVGGVPAIDGAIAEQGLKALKVDTEGLNATDRHYLLMIAMRFDGGPVGIENLTAALGESRDTIEDMIEPFLIQKGLVHRTPRGRALTAHALKHLGLNETTLGSQQIGLFAQE